MNLNVIVSVSLRGRVQCKALQNSMGIYMKHIFNLQGISFIIFDQNIKGYKATLTKVYIRTTKKLDCNYI